MTRYSVFVIPLLLSLLAACSPAVDQNSITDRKELIQKVLEYALVEEKIPDFNLDSDNKNKVLSAENLFAHERPEIDGMTFVVLTNDQIQQKANQEGDFLYLEFQKMNIKGNEAVIGLANHWAVSKQSEENGMGYLSGGGFELVFQKKNGQWIMKDVSKQWIS